VFFAFVYLLLCRLIRPIRGSDSMFEDKVELAVLRHQTGGPFASGGKADAKPS